MKQSVRFQNLILAGKLRCEIRIIVDDNRSVEYKSTFENNQSTGITLFPIISLIILRPSEIDDNGYRVKAPWNMNDSIGMTKYNFPTFLNNLKEIKDDMKTPELYTYQGKRLELNEEIAEKSRKVFPIGNAVIELVPVVIVQQDDSRIEGIRMKFNNESSTVLLSLNDIDALIYNLEYMDIDSIALLMYLNYITKPNKPTMFDSSSLSSPKVDIVPKEFIP